MNFVNPELLWLIPIVVTVDLICLILAAKKRKIMLEKLLGGNAENPAALHLSQARRIWRNILLLASLILLIAAAARPCRTFQLRTLDAKGRDILVLFDVSKSMNAADLPPSRMEHAKMLISRLAMQNPGDRFGLVAFAGTAYLSCPLTSDPATFSEYVRELSTDTIPVGGTNIESALIVADRAFKAAEGHNRAILLLTDGEELQGDAKKLIADLRKRHIPLFIAGLGSPDAGSPIPFQDENGANSFVRDKQGKLVSSKLNEKMLAALAKETGGIYLRSTAIRPGIELFQTALDHLDRIGKEKLNRRIPVDEFPKILIACAILLLLYFVISERPGKLKKTAVTLVMSFFVLGAAEQTPTKETPEVPKAPQDSVECYNAARSIQESGKPGFEPLYEEVLKRNNVSAELRSKSFHNLGAAQHNKVRNTLRKAVGSLQGQQLDQSLKELNEAEKQAAATEELYRSSAASGAEAMPVLGSNLSRLAGDKERIQQLKKKIEELKKQQQKTRDQTKKAQQEQPQNQKQDSKQEQKQNSALNQAQKEAQKLKDQAQKMQQQKLAQSAQKAKEELDKAEQARQKQDEKAAQKHLQEALKALGEEKKDSKAQNQPQPGKEQKKEEQKQTAPQAVPQNKQEPKPDKTGTEQLLQMLQDEEKELRDTVQKRNRMRRRQVEKDW